MEGAIRSQDDSYTFVIGDEFSGQMVKADPETLTLKQGVPEACYDNCSSSSFLPCASLDSEATSLILVLICRCCHEEAVHDVDVFKYLRSSPDLLSLLTSDAKMVFVFE